MLSVGSMARVRTLFLQFVSLCFTFAFHSVYLQLPGLYGDHGILPARTVINQKILESSSTSHLLSNSPSLLWLAPFFGFAVLTMMEVLALAGTLLSLLITVMPSYNIKITTLVLWLLYLSLFQVSPAPETYHRLTMTTDQLSAGGPDIPPLSVGHSAPGDWRPGRPRQPRLPGI